MNIYEVIIPLTATFCLITLKHDIRHSEKFRRFTNEIIQESVTLVLLQICTSGKFSMPTVKDQKPSRSQSLDAEHFRKTILSWVDSLITISHLSWITHCYDEESINGASVITDSALPLCSHLSNISSLRFRSYTSSSLINLKSINSHL